MDWYGLALAKGSVMTCSVPAAVLLLQDVWRRSLSRPNLNFRDVAMHLHALQRFCHPPRPTTHPTRYQFM